MKSLEYHSGDRYTSDGWIVKPKRRVEITKNRETGYYEVIDTETGEKVGNSQTRNAAFIIRRKYEARGFGKAQLKPAKPVVCEFALPVPAPWSISAGASDDIILSLMDASKREFYAGLEQR